MPKDSQNQHSQVSSHKDGERESVINDSKGQQLGVTTEFINTGGRKGKDKLNLKPDEKMREFKENMENLPNKKHHPDG
ncbi:hypothetical protein [Halobacillus andaensis]|uniref:hypothetical protein n=1 Tax=Halobacillus andaensis TaxID=1176239 RepID=UPI003D7486C7